MTAAAPKLSEAAFQRYVTDVAARFGWKCWHVPAPMRATKQGFVGAKEAKGLPDLVLISEDPPRLVFAELKAEGGKLSAEQQEFLQAAQTVARHQWPWITGYPGRCIGVYAWTPDQEITIETILRTRVLI